MDPCQYCPLQHHAPLLALSPTLQTLCLCLATPPHAPDRSRAQTRSLYLTLPLLCTHSPLPSLHPPGSGHLRPPPGAPRTRLAPPPGGRPTRTSLTHDPQLGARRRLARAVRQACAALRVSAGILHGRRGKNTSVVGFVPVGLDPRARKWFCMYRGVAKHVRIFIHRDGKLSDDEIDDGVQKNSPQAKKKTR